MAAASVESEEPLAQLVVEALWVTEITLEVLDRDDRRQDFATHADPDLAKWAHLFDDQAIRRSLRLLGEIEPKLRQLETTLREDAERQEHPSRRILVAP